MKFVFLSCAVGLLFSQPAWCDASDHYNRVSYSSVATRKVDNDLLVVRMSAEFNGPQPARIADQLAAVLKAAFKKAEAYSAVKAITGDQSTEPVYGKSEKFIGYRGHAEIILKGRDFDAVASLIAQLQGDMRLVDLNFSVSPELLKKVEGELMVEAMSAFRKQAEALRGMLGGASYKIVAVNIGRANTGSRTEMMNNLVLSKGNAPELHGGQGEVMVQCTGTIEIIP